MKPLLSLIAVVTILAIGVSGCTSEPAGTTPKPVLTRPSLPAGVQAAIVIGDVPGLIDRLGSMASRIDPSMTADSLRSSGAMLGDPGLAAWSPGSGLAIIMLDAQRFFAVAEVSEEGMAGYQQFLSGMGMTATNVGGRLVASTDAGLIESATAMKSSIDQLLSGGKPSISVTAAVADLLKPWEAMIDQFLKTTIAMVDATGTDPSGMSGKILEAEAKLFLSLARQTDVVQLKIGLEDVLSLEKTVAPVPGSSFAQVISANQEPCGSELLDRLPGTGSIRLAVRVNPTAVHDFFAAEIPPLINGVVDADLKQAAQEYVDLVLGSTLVYGPEWAMDMAPPDGGLMQGSFLSGTQDPEKLLGFMQNGADMWKGPLGKIYAEMGQQWDVKFKRNARQHSGVEIHELVMKVKFADASDEQAKLMEELMGDLRYEFAIQNQEFMGAFGGESMDSLIDGKMKSTTPLAAIAAHGSGGITYADIRIGALVAAFAPIMQAATAAAGGDTEISAQISAVESALADVSPVTMAVFTSGELLQSRMAIPLGEILGGIARAQGGTPAPTTQKK